MVYVFGFGMNKGLCMKKLIMYIVIVIAALCMTACGNDRQDVDEIVYSIEYAREEALALPRQVLVGQNGIWVLTAEKENCLHHINENMTSVEWREKEEEYIIALAVGENTLYLCVGNGKDAQIRKMGNDYQWEALTDISSADMGSNVQDISAFWVDSEENLYFVMGNNIVALYDEGKVSSLKGEITCAAFLEEKESGKVQCLAGTYEEIKLSDIGKDGVVEKWSINYPCRQNIQVLYSDDAQICLTADNNLLCIERASGRILSEANLLRSGLSSTEIYAGYIEEQGLENERIHLFVKSENGNLELYDLERQKSVNSEQKNQIVYGTFMINHVMQEQIVKFNRENEQYYVTVRVYGNGDIESGKLKLQAELAGGDAPDIIDLYFFNDYYAYAEQGYLQDLTPYLNESMHGEEILWKIVEAYQVDKKTYALIPHYTLSGIVISPADSPKIDEWNLQTMFDLIEENAGEKNIFVDSSASQMLSYALWGMKEDFIQQDTGKANFACEEFMQLLQYCKQYGNEEVPFHRSVSMEEMAEQTLFLNMTLSSPYDYMTLFGSYGRDVKIYGYPTAEGQRYIANMSVDACGIYAKSENKEGAWEFLKTLLDSDYQEKEGVGWPICENAFEASWEKAKNQKIRINNADIDSVKDSEIAVFEDIIQHGEFQNGILDAKIRSIILEEAEVFFHGDKNAEETAQIIQSRVQLILDE